MNAVQVEQKSYEDAPAGRGSASRHFLTVADVDADSARYYEKGLWRPHTDHG